MILVIAVLSLSYSAPTSSKSSSNHELLTKLGLSRVRVNPSHHRKRLAVQSRHHTRADDSNMFVIKLPPNNYYYAHNMPNKNHITGDKKLPVGFKSNGKPGRIYHWNLPVLKKILGNGAKNHISRSEDDDSDIIDIKHTPTWTHWENEVGDKEPTKAEIYGKRKVPSYYAPAKSHKRNFMKMFPGNGKPQTFYVIEKSKKKTAHQLLLP